MQRAESNRNAPITAGLCVSGFFLVPIAVSLTTVDRLKLAYLAGHPVRPMALPSWFGVTDYALFASATVLLLYGLVLEIRFRALSRLIAGERLLPMLAALGCAVLWFAHALLAPGLLVTGDAGSHVSRIAHLIADIRDGSSLVWDNDYFCGGPFLQFTGPVFHWLAAAIGLVLGATPSVKILVVGGRLASAALMFAFLRRSGATRAAAFLGALFYAGAFVQTYLFSVRSTFPQILNLAALPAILFSIETMLRPRANAVAGCLGFSLLYVLMLGNHQPTAVIYGLYVAAYTAARLSMVGWTIRRVAMLGSAWVIAGIASVYFTLPFIAEKWATADDFSAGIVGVRWPDLRHLVVWGGQGSGQSYAAYLGASLIACALSGAVAIRSGRVTLTTSRLWLLFAGLSAASLFITGSYVRETIFTLLFTTVAAAFAIQAWSEAAPSAWRLPLLALLAFVLDIGPTAIQPWVRPDMRTIAAAGDYLASHAPGRVLEVDLDHGTPKIPVGPTASPLLYARVQMLYGPHKMDATRGHNAAVAVSKLAELDFQRSGGLSYTTQGLLSLYNVGWVVGIDGARMGLPPAWPDLAADPVLGHVETLPTATPFLTSGQLEPEPRPASLDGPPLWEADFPGGRGASAAQAVAAAWRAMAVNLADRRAASFLVPQLPAGPLWQQRYPAAPMARLIDYRVEPGRVRLTLQANGPGYVRLSHPVYPTLSVSLDGHAIQPAADIFSMTVLPIHPGLNDIDMVARTSLLRRICLTITAVSVSGLGIGLLAMAAQGAARSSLRPRPYPG